MNDFPNIQKLVQVFILEAMDLLGNVDRKLMELEKLPDDKNILSVIFFDFHSIKGGAGFLFNNQADLNMLCRLTESVLTRLRNEELRINPYLLNLLFVATGEARLMIDDLGRGVQPQRALQEVLDALEALL